MDPPVAAVSARAREEPAAAAAADPSEDEPDPVFIGAVDLLVRAGIPVTALLGEEIAAEIEAGADLEDFQFAVQEAADLNVRKWRYVQTILRRRREDAAAPAPDDFEARKRRFVLPGSERCFCPAQKDAHYRIVCHPEEVTDAQRGYMRSRPAGARR